MPAPVPSYRCHKASGKAVVTLNGRDFYLGSWNTPLSRDTYDRLVAEWLANHRQMPSAVTVGERSVVELADTFLDFAKVYYTKGWAHIGSLYSTTPRSRPVQLAALSTI